MTKFQKLHKHISTLYQYYDSVLYVKSLKN